jgi:hypothetical protein
VVALWDSLCLEERSVCGSRSVGFVDGSMSSDPFSDF